MKQVHTEARKANQKVFAPTKAKGKGTSQERMAVRVLQGLRNGGVNSTKISRHTEATKLKGLCHRTNRFLLSNQRK